MDSKTLNYKIKLDAQTFMMFNWFLGFWCSGTSIAMAIVHIQHSVSRGSCSLRCVQRFSVTSCRYFRRNFVRILCSSFCVYIYVSPLTYSSRTLYRLSSRWSIFRLLFFLVLNLISTLFFSWFYAGTIGWRNSDSKKCSIPTLETKGRKIRHWTRTETNENFFGCP